MHAHRIQVFNGTNDDAIVLAIPHHFHFIFFPAQERLFNQQLFGGRRLQAALADFNELFLIVGNAAARAAHGEGWPDNGRKAHRPLHLLRFFHAVGNAGTRRAQANPGHRALELFAVFRLVNRLARSADHLDAKLFQHAMLGQVQRAIQRRLPAHGGQDRIRALFFDDVFQHAPGDRLDVGHIRHVRVGHDRGRIGIHQNDAVAFLTQCLARLRAGIVKLASLTNNDRACANDENTFNVCALGHSAFLLSRPC